LSEQGTIKKIKFFNEISDWGVFDFIRDDGSKFTAKGKLGPQNPGYKLTLSGRWLPNPRGAGQVYEVSYYEVMPPDTEEGIYLYLTSGLFKGITKRIARELVDTFGKKTLDLMDYDINIINTIKGIGAKTFIKIRDSYEEAKPQQEKVLALHHDYKFTFAESLYLVNTFPQNIMTLIEKSPYSIYYRVNKINFVRYDRVIIGKGHDQRDPQRIREVLQHQMKLCFREGNTVMPYREVLESAMSYLALDRYLIENELHWLIEKRRLWLAESGQEKLLQSQWFYTAEKEIANRLSLIMSAPAEKQLTFDPTAPALGSLKPHQLRAVPAPFLHKVSIVTGRPGAGKTTLLRTMLDLLEAQNLTILAVSPTGKAAQRLKEVTRRECSTIHRALGATHEADEFLKNDIDPLDVDVVVVDETSMLDTGVLRALLRAIPYTTRVVLIGDVEQLPSVAPGAVYRDLIDSQCFPVYWLTQVLRITKEDGSLPTPLLMAGGVREGKFLKQTPNDDEWGYYPTANNKETRIKVREVIQELVSEGLTYHDVQVFSPTNENDMGVAELNVMVKACFRPDSEPNIEVGDKVMQRENNYELGVFNGDIGVVKEIYPYSKGNSKDDPVLMADMSGRLVEFTKRDLYHLVLAYAITGHKSQGSEYPHVIIVIPDNHLSLMDRYWLYTLITRCQVKAHLIGNERVIEQCVRSRRSHQRRTLLREKLVHFVPHCGEVHK
jgi:exodeoxyribonuclease V alpha subunit